MKKILSILLALVFVFALSACNNNGGSAKGKETASANSQALTQQKNDNSSEIKEDTSTKTKTITRDRAIEIALDAAKLNKSDVRDLEAELDRERNEDFWEVDFEHGGYDYSYDINATTGEALKIEKERD